MSFQEINVGTVANDKNGDGLRSAMQKVNANFLTSLAGSGGAAEVGYQPPGGFTARTVQDKLRDIEDGRDAGLSQSATASQNTTAMQNYIAYLQGKGRAGAVFPAGSFDVNGELAITADNIALIGNGRGQTIFVQKTMSAKTFSSSGKHTLHKGLGVFYDGTPTSGGDAFYYSDEFPVLEDLWAVTSHRAFTMVGANGFSIRSIYGTNHVSAGWTLDTIVGGTFSDVRLNAGDYVNADAGQVILVDQVEAILGMGLETIKGRRGLMVDAASPGMSARAAYLEWKGVIFDDFAEESIIKYMFDCDVELQFSGGRTGAGFVGAQWIDCQKIRGTIKGHYCGLSGQTWDEDCAECSVEVAASSNSCMDPGNHPGVIVDGDANSMRVTMTTGGNDLIVAPITPLGDQTYDIVFTAGTGTKNVLIYNGPGGSTGGAQFGSTGAGSCALINGDLFLASAGVINFGSGDVTFTHSAGVMVFAGASSGWYFDQTISPTANDGGALGGASLAWSDLFLASGAVINFNNSDVTLTHSANALTLAGGSFIPGLAEYADDPAAASGGVPVGGLYHTSGAVKVRLS